MGKKIFGVALLLGGLFFALAPHDVHLSLGLTAPHAVHVVFGVVMVGLGGWLMMGKKKPAK